ncbi:hypothetical protein J5X84_12130 [Streptosporangiaceae bacterium NEAU-GS5]|nr:hypothetical protein [Streptosporangiaceae bacterium NEAU-GS5]
MTSATTRAPMPIRSDWLSFAGLLSILLGAFNVFEGIVAFAKKSYFLTATGQLLIFNFTTWGWILLIVGIIQIVVGAGILKGMLWARIAGVVLAFLACILHFLFIAAYPFWSIVAIAVSILVMYALISPPKNASA